MDTELLLKLAMKHDVQELYVMWQREDKSNRSPTYVMKMDMAFAYAFFLVEQYSLTREFRDKLAIFQAYVATLNENE